MTILAGDIGGTSTRLAFFAVADGQLRSVAEMTYRSREHQSLNEIVAHFVAAQGRPIAAAAFGIAGPVRGGKVETPNLAWTIDAAELARDLRLPTVALLNDLEANASGIAVLAPHDFEVLNGGAADAAGNQAVISAGTGLGEAGLYWDGRQHRPFASEGGHGDFAPRTPLEAELLRYLLGRFERVSYERVLSGPGLHNLYQFLRDTGRGTELPRVAEEMREQDSAAVIARAALAGESELCVSALDLFVALYGAEAGNLALRMMATGGVYIGGGIAPKILDRLKGPAFMQAFVAKGRMRSLLESIPVRVIKNDRTALLGAARYAAR